MLFLFTFPLCFLVELCGVDVGGIMRGKVFGGFLVNNLINVTLELSNMA